MSYVVINAIEVPPDRRETLEQRFAARAGTVSSAAGFESFQLLRPANEGAGDRYLVYTRWRAEEDFDAWRSSESFGAGHGSSGPPAATSAQVLAYEVVEIEEARG